MEFMGDQKYSFYEESASFNNSSVKYGKFTDEDKIDTSEFAHKFISISKNDPIPSVIENHLKCLRQAISVASKK